MQKFLLFLKGYIFISVTGFAPERFVNLCGNRGIFLWGISKKEDSYFMYMKLQDFFKIAPLVRKTKTKVVLRKRIGLPFLMPEIYKRKMFMLGCMVTFFLWYLSSLFVWKIDLQGNVKLTEEDMIRTLREAGVSVGAKLSQMNYEELEKFLRQKYSDIIWISVKQNGTIIEIAIRENQTISPPVKEEETTPCNLVAATNGIVKEMVVRSGIPLVSIGTEVSRGDVLVQGSIPIYNDDGTLRSITQVKADADIWIETEEPVHIELPKIYTQREYTGRYYKNLALISSGNDLFKTDYDAKYLYYDEMTQTMDEIPFLLWEMPLTIQSRKTMEYQVVEYENDFTEAGQKLEIEFAEFLANLMEKGVQIISKNVRIEEDYANWILNGTVTVLSQAYTEHKIEEIYE